MLYLSVFSSEIVANERLIGAKSALMRLTHPSVKSLERCPTTGSNSGVLGSFTQPTTRVASVVLG